MPDMSDSSSPAVPRCTGEVVSAVWWLSEEQNRPCRCALDLGHSGAHACEHNLGGSDD